MNNLSKQLTILRRQEQENRQYPTSSKWYTGLNNAIHFIERAENANDPIERFRDCWSALYNTIIMHHKAGDTNEKSFDRWVLHVIKIPQIIRLFKEQPKNFPVSDVQMPSKNFQKLRKNYYNN